MEFWGVGIYDIFLWWLFRGWFILIKWYLYFVWYGNDYGVLIGVGCVGDVFGVVSGWNGWLLFWKWG